MAYIDGNEVLFSPQLHITIDGITEYSAEKTYTDGDLVLYDGVIYKHLGGTSTGIEPTDRRNGSQYWQKLMTVV